MTASARKRWLLAVVLGAALQGLTIARAADDAAEDVPWNEVEPDLPAMPSAEGLIEFYVTAAATGRFFVDPATISVGSDGVVRYVVVVKSATGASGTSFEGLRCETRERRLYAFGRADHTWSRAKAARWSNVSNAGPNRYPWTLMREYFCPGGVAIRSVAEGVDALKRGGHPDVQRTPGS